MTVLGMLAREGLPTARALGMTWLTKSDRTDELDGYGVLWEWLSVTHQERWIGEIYRLRK